MALYETWKDQAYTHETQESYDAFWNAYLPKEQSIYEYLLEHKDETVEGTVAELAQKFDIEPMTFVGFLDGINESLEESLTIDELTEDSTVSLAIDFEKLFYNMLEAKAKWLYTLPQWSDILSEEKQKEIKKKHMKANTVVKGEKIGRNDPCPCGSGKKYKKCCLK